MHSDFTQPSTRDPRAMTRGGHVGTWHVHAGVWPYCFLLIAFLNCGCESESGGRPGARGVFCIFPRYSRRTFQKENESSLIIDMDFRLPTRAANSSKTVLLALFNFIRTVDQTMLKFSSKIMSVRFSRALACDPRDSLVIAHISLATTPEGLCRLRNHTEDSN